MGYPIQQNQTAQPLEFLMVDSADHLTGKTGLTVTVTLSKNGGSFASPAGAVAEIGVGWYKVAGNATDANTLGPLLLHATATGADPTDDRFDVVAYNPQDAVRLGLTALPNAFAGALGGVPVGDASGRVDLTTDALDADALKADAANEIRTGLSTLTGADVQTAMTSQGYTPARAGYLDTLNGLVAAIWAYTAGAGRTLTSLTDLLSTLATYLWITFTPRRLTSTAAEQAAANVGTTLVIPVTTAYSVTLTGLAINTGHKHALAIKVQASDDDDSAVVYVDSENGLTRLGGEAYATDTDASLTLASTSVTFALTSAAGVALTGYAGRRGLVYGVKDLVSDTVITESAVNFTWTVVHAIS